MQAVRELRGAGRNGVGLRSLSGIQGIRRLRRERVTNQQMRTRMPSLRQRRALDAAHTYMASKVDPVIGPAITYLLLAKHDSTLDGLKNYLRRLTAGETAAAIQAATAMTAAAVSTKVGGGDRVFMAESILPLCQGLMAHLVRTQPPKVVPAALAWLASDEAKRMAMALPSPKALAANGGGVLEAGAKVHVRYGGGKKWFAGEVVSISDKGLFHVKYEDGDEERGVPKVNVRLVPSFGEGDAVGVNYQGKGKWYSGRIAKVLGGGKYDVAYDDGDAEESVPVLRIQNSDQPDAVKPGAAAAKAPEAESRLVQLLKGIKAMDVVMLGLDGVGKTTLLKAAQGDPNPKAIPSGGFKPVKMNVGATKITFFDLGGRAKLRGIWPNYYHDAHAWVYVIDAAATPEAFAEAIAQLRACLAHEYLKRKPLLLFLNKQDQPGARASDVIRNQLTSALGVEEGDTVRIQEVTAYPPAMPSGEADPAMEAGLEWLFEVVAGKFATLSERVEQDKALVQEQQRRAQVARDRRVFAKTLRKAFPAPGQEAEECLSPTEGVEFLAMETGLTDAKNLSPDGVFLARACGYEKLALQIIGAMRVPISKKKTPMTWAEIRDYVFDIREELGIPEDLLGAEA